MEYFQIQLNLFKDRKYSIMYNDTRIANLSTDINGGKTRLLGTSSEQVNYKLVISFFCLKYKFFH